MNGVGMGNARRRASTTTASKRTSISKDVDADDAHNHDARRPLARRQRRAASILKRLPESQVLDEIESQVRRNLWRDCLLLMVGCLALTLIGYVETHASEERHLPSIHRSTDNSNTTTSASTNSHGLGIVDTGFSITAPMYRFLRIHRHSWNDAFAFCNSLVLLIPGIYGAYTAWKGQYQFIFRILFTQLLRSFCGWATYLPPSNEYLMSYYDFPDGVQCLLAQADCSAEYPGESPANTTTGVEEVAVLPFVSFFSGHVATLVICGNDVWLSGFHRLTVAIHILNVLQIVRLLATRGHYSIDIVVAWFIAVLGSNPAGRLGRYYSRGDSFQAMLLPTTATEAFESLTGVDQVRNEQRVSTLLRHTDMEQMFRAVVQHQEDDEEQSLLLMGEQDDEHQELPRLGNKFRD